jgi:hypothetical protein
MTKSIFRAYRIYLSLSVALSLSLSVGVFSFAPSLHLSIPHVHMCTVKAREMIVILRLQAFSPVHYSSDQKAVHLKNYHNWAGKLVRSRVT